MRYCWFQSSKNLRLHAVRWFGTTLPTACAVRIERNGQTLTSRELLNSIAPGVFAF